MMQDVSNLDNSGFTYTVEKAHKWCCEQALAIQKAIGEEAESAKGRMWSYRHDSHDILTLAIFVGDSLVYTVTMTSVGGYDVDLDCDDICVPDMVEAVHLAGIISQSVNIPWTIGNLSNETNSAVLSGPLEGDQTNGHIRLVK